MPDLVFPSAWLAVVERRLTDPDVAAALTRRDLPVETVVAVARVEAAHADPTGRVTLGANDLARAADATPKLAKRARLALITMGAEVFVSIPGAAGRAVRQLQLPLRQ